jgi:hypothetical protein
MRVHVPHLQLDGTFPRRRIWTSEKRSRSFEMITNKVVFGHTQSGHREVSSFGSPPRLSFRTRASALEEENLDMRHEGPRGQSDGQRSPIYVVNRKIRYVLCQKPRSVQKPPHCSRLLQSREWASFWQFCGQPRPFPLNSPIWQSFQLFVIGDSDHPNVTGKRESRFEMPLQYMGSGT